MTRENSENGSPNERRTYVLPIVSSDALPLSYWRFVGARPLNKVHVTDIPNTVTIFKSKQYAGKSCSITEKFFQFRDKKQHFVRTLADDLLPTIREPLVCRATGV